MEHEQKLSVFLLVVRGSHSSETLSAFAYLVKAAQLQLLYQRENDLQ